MDSYQSGVVSYPYTNLEEGVHQLKIKVWDVHNNSSEAYTEFVVVANEGLVVENLMNYPNPFSDFTRIHFEHNRPDDELDVRMDIYDMNGKDKVFKSIYFQRIICEFDLLGMVI